jgi:hypothetical protein
MNLTMLPMWLLSGIFFFARSAFLGRCSRLLRVFR